MADCSRSFIPGFKPLATSIWQYIPKITSPSSSSSTSTSFSKETLSEIPPPDLILLFPWTGAQPRYIAKYTSTYQTLFPHTPMLVLTTSLKDLIIRSPASKQNRLQPAITAIQTLNPPVSRILVHAFSEGGSNKSVEFAEAWHGATGQRLPCLALCLDSTPGHPRYLRLCSAIKNALPPNRIVRGAGLVIGGMVLGGFWITYSCVKGANNNVIDTTRRRLLDETFWDVGTQRCYLFSKGDELIFWEDVQEHAEEARKLGLEVLMIRFEGSGHCSHIKEDEGEYWGGVVEAWERGVLGVRQEKSENKVTFDAEKFKEAVLSVNVVCL